MSETVITRTAIGTSVQGRRIFLESNYDWEEPRNADCRPTLLIGGQHGNEPASVHLLEHFVERYLADLPGSQQVLVCAQANPDGILANTRYNANGVDLNRNCDHNWSPESLEPAGPEPWSEPEIRALRDLILRIEPGTIVSLHWALAEVEADGHQSTQLARAMWNALSPEERRPYRIRTLEDTHGALPSAAQPEEGICPGSLGQWCGHRVIYRDGSRPKMVTLELPYDPKAPNRPPVLPAGHLDRLRRAWEQDAQAYLRAVEGAAHKMLLAACAFNAA